MSFGTAEVERLESRARERLGATLQGKYKLDRVLGLGGMATVYAATHRNGKEVALKLLHPEYAEHSEVRERFLREGYVANRVRHPGAVSVIDDDVTSGGDAFLVMELLEGSTVEEFWEQREHRVHPAWVTAILLQVLDVIAAAHEQGIIHRDLKPANLFLTLDGAVKVLDFGIARLRAPGAHTTNVGSLLGTPAYMAPEQAMGRSALVDETTDLWAIAAIAFALLSGDVVHPGESMQQTLIFAATRPAPPLGPLAPGAPTAIVRVIERALAFERAERWGSAVILRGALLAAAQEAYGEVPDAATLRSALGVVRVRPQPSIPDATVDAPAAPAARAVTLEAAPAPEPPAESRRDETPIPSQRATLLGLDAGRSSVTGPAVSSSAAAPRAPWGTGRARARLAGVAALVAASLASVALLAVQVGHGGRPGPAVGTSSEGALVATTTAAIAPDDRPRAAPAATTLASTIAPLAAATPAPTLEPAPARPRAATPRLTAPAASSSTSLPPLPRTPGTVGRAGCNPPYVLDFITGRKKWKVECL